MSSDTGWRHAPERGGPAQGTDAWIDSLAWLMDTSLGVGKFRFGLDGIVGLIPGAGDMVSGVVAAMIVVAAARKGLPRATVLRMVANVAIDSTLGAIPLFGDLFDVYFKSNIRNAKLYRQAVEGRANQKQDAAFVALVAVVVLVVVSVPIAVAAWVIAGLTRL